MQRWADELSSHPIQTTLKMFDEQIERETDITDPVLAAEKTRFSKVVRLIRKVIADLDPDIAPIELLNQFQNSLQNQGVVTTISNYGHTLNPALFQQANNQITPSLNYLYQLSNLKFTRSTRRADIDAATKSFSEFSEATRRQLDKFSEASQQGIDKIAAATVEVQSVYQTAKHIEDSLSSKFSSIDIASTELANQQRTEFVTAQVKRQEEFSALVSALRTESTRKLEEMIDRAEEEVGKQEVRLESKVTEIIKDARQKHQAILDLYGLSARDSVSGGHKRIADREYTSARNWRWCTILAVILAIAWVGYSLLYLLPAPEPERLFWVQVGKSIALTGLLISVAVYASKQANLHRLNERRTRAFFLQVQAFDPFVSALPPDLQHRLKEELTRRMFGPEDHLEEARVSGGAEFQSLDHAGIVNQVITQIAGLLSAKK
jgi:hypothetical protein